jgi:hypothetical protein
MSDIVFLGGAPLRPDRDCEGYWFHVLMLKRTKFGRPRKVVGYWMVGRWYLSGVAEAIPASEGPEYCTYLAPLPQPSYAPIGGPWHRDGIVGADVETLHWLLPPRRPLGSILQHIVQPALLFSGAWSTIGDAEWYDTPAMEANAWRYVCQAKIGEVPLPRVPQNPPAGQHHPFPPGTPASLGISSPDRAE